MSHVKSTKKGSKKGKAEGSKRKLTAEQTAQIEAEAEAFKQRAHDYAQKAYMAAVDHFEKHHGDPFSLSRLAVVYGEPKPGDVHMVVTLPGIMRDRAVSDEEVRGWIRDAELLARTFEHPECSEAFRTAFCSIFDAGLRSESGLSFETPEVLRVALPLLMLDASGTNHVCESIYTLRLFKLLSSDLNSDKVDAEVRASLSML